MTGRKIPTKLYRKILTHIPIACVDVAVMSRRRILLVERTDAPAKGKMWLPGGRIHKGELLSDAAIRKAQEEASIDCVAGPIFYTAETIFEDGPGEIPVHSINVCILLHPVDDDPVVHLDDHHSNFKWVSHVDLSYDPYVQECLIRAWRVANGAPYSSAAL